VQHEIEFATDTSLPSFAATVRLPKIEPKPSARLILDPRQTLKHEDRSPRSVRRAEARDADHGACRIRLVEVRHDLVDAGEMRKVGQIDCELDRIGERSATSLCTVSGFRKHDGLVLDSSRAAGCRSSRSGRKIKRAAGRTAWE